MKAPALADGLRIVVALVYNRLGWPGGLGLVAIVAAAATTWFGRPLPHPAVNLPDPVPGSIQQSSIDQLALSEAAEIPLIETQVEQAAMAQGLGWPQALYRISPGGAETFGSLEIRCNLKGPYPQLRRFVAQVMQDIPASTLRELVMSRSSSDTADVEGKFTFVVYLRDKESTPTVRWNAQAGRL